MDYPYDHKVGQCIRLVREELGLTQEQLAARLQVRECDLTRSALAKIEAGQRHIYAWELRVMREVLDVPYERLLP